MERWRCSSDTAAPLSLRKVSSNNPEFELLESLYQSQQEIGEAGALKAAPVSQRELAARTGLSLGLTNTLIKRFIERGWVKLLHLNGRKVKYALTAEGMEEIAVRAVDYFARASQNASLYRHKIEAFVGHYSRLGYTGLLLLSPHELDFLFEYACLKYGLVFCKEIDACPDEFFMSDARCLIVCESNTVSSSCERLRQRLADSRSVVYYSFSQILACKEY